MPSPPAPTDSARDPLTGIGLALLGSALFATKGIWIKLALAEGIDSVTSLTWRMIVSVPVFVAVGVVSYRRDRRRRSAAAEPTLGWTSFLSAAGLGILGYYVASYLDFTALEYISVQFDRLILLTYPFFVVLFGVVFFGRKVTRPMIAALLVSYLGIALIFYHDFGVEGDAVLLGGALVLGAAITYASYQILAKPMIDRMGAELFTSAAMSAAGAMVMLHFLCTHPVSDLFVSPYGLMLMVGLALVATVLPGYAISAAIGRIGSERTAVVGNISPVITVALAVAILGEAFTVFHAVGTALVLAGVWLFAKKPKAG
jgi:drug/metabolite transporter (DMT)-like permease